MIVALTRPRGVDSQLAQQLQASGCQVLDCAMTSIVDATPEELDHAVQLFEAADACVLVSPQAVKAALAASCSTLPGKLIAVMGPASKALLVQGGIAPQYILESATQDGLGLADELVARLHHAPDCAVPACVVIGRARSGRDDLARALSAQGLMVNFATLYHRNDLAWPDTLAQRLFAACDNDLRILFTTSSRRVCCPPEGGRSGAHGRCVAPRYGAVHPSKCGARRGRRGICADHHADGGRIRVASVVTIGACLNLYPRSRFPLQLLRRHPRLLP
jgi:uroporphyrinogen-III synthase